MIAFKVSVGGELIAKAGLNERGVLSCLISAGKDSELVDDKSDFLRIFVGALKNGDEESEHLRWAMRSLKCGDSILVEVVDEDNVDEPVSRSRYENK